MTSALATQSHESVLIPSWHSGHDENYVSKSRKHFTIPTN